MQTVNLDLSVKSIIPLLHAKQGDVGRKVKVILTDNGSPYAVPAGAAVSVWFDGASGEGNYTDVGAQSAIAVSGNEITVEMITQMLAKPGNGRACLVINAADGTQIGTWNISYFCEAVPGAESSSAGNYYTAFSEAVKNLAYPDVTLSLDGKAADAGATGRALANKAPAGYGYGEVSVTAFWNDEDGTQLEASLDNFFTDPNKLDKVYRFKLVDYPACVVSGNGGFADIMCTDQLEEWPMDITIVYYSFHGIATKQKLRGTWYPWEYVSPPLEPGVEYRTTERWDGKPVYTKLLSLGYVEAGYSSFTSGVSFGTRVIRSAVTHGGEIVPFQPAGGNISAYEKQVSVAPYSVHFYSGSSVTGSDLYVQAWYVKD